MTLADFRRLTAHLPGETGLYYHAYYKGCRLSQYLEKDLWLYPHGESAKGVVLNPGPDYDDRRPFDNKDTATANTQEPTP